MLPDASMVSVTLEYKRSSGACKEPNAISLFKSWSTSSRFTKSRRVDKQSASTFGGGDGGCAIAYPPYVLGSGAVRQYCWMAGMAGLALERMQAVSQVLAAEVGSVVCGWPGKRRVSVAVLFRSCSAR